jgi:Linear amide C-N hydrolases, choloylglycine hydrolase family
MKVFPLVLVIAACLQEFQIPLDGSPYQMYREPAIALKEKSLKFIHELLHQINGALISSIKQAYFNTRHLYPTKVEEIRGVADALSLTEEEVFVFQYIYEIYTYCTTIIARNSDGNIIVGRNLDYDFVEDLAQTHYMAIYTINGKESFRCTNYGGFIGVSTCMKSHSYIVTLNSRYSLLNTTIEDNLVHISQGAGLVTWAIRDAINSSSSFEQLKSYLTEVHIVAPAYFNVAGIEGNQGCVINRERNFTKNTICLSDEKWYIVQVNTDFDIVIPPHTVDRRTPAEKKLTEVGQLNVNENALYDILSVYPNRNYLTIFTA